MLTCVAGINRDFDHMCWCFGSGACLAVRSGSRLLIVPGSLCVSSQRRRAGKVDLRCFFFFNVLFLCFSWFCSVGCVPVLNITREMCEPELAAVRGHDQ